MPVFTTTEWTVFAITASVVMLILYLLERPKKRPVEQALPTYIGGNTHNRLFARRKGNSTRLFITDMCCIKGPIQGFVIDRSQGGLGFIIGGYGDMSPAEFYTGRLLKIKSVKMPLDASWNIVEVRHRKVETDCIFIGCKFQKPISASDISYYG